jgi:hypothetical protein
MQTGWRISMIARATAEAAHARCIALGGCLREAVRSIHANLRTAPLEREEFRTFGFAAQEVASDAGRDDAAGHQGTVKQPLRGEEGVAGRPAGLLEPRCRIHRVADEGYLALESADLSGHKRPRMKACPEPGNLPVPVQEIGTRRF